MKYLIPVLLLLTACDGGPSEGFMSNDDNEELVVFAAAVAVTLIASMRKRLIRV